MEAAISSRKIDGTICFTGRISAIAVMLSSEKPKPEKPRTIAARKIAALDSASTCQSLCTAAHSSASMRNPGDETPPALYGRALTASKVNLVEPVAPSLSSRPNVSESRDPCCIAVTRKHRMGPGSAPLRGLAGMTV